MVSRRKFLGAMAGASGMALLPKLALANTSPFTLKAEPTTLTLLNQGKSTSLWGYNGSSPGMPIVVNKGEVVNARFVNGISQPTAVHWHGIRIANAMDGVPELTQKAVKPKASFDYQFVVPDAGTYWYHSHHRSLEQVARGLYGALIVQETNPPEVDADIIAFVDDWRLNQDGSQELSFDNWHDMSHEGRMGNIAKAIFQRAPATLKRNQRVRLRLINAATDRIFPLTLRGMEGKVVAYDGMPLAQLEPLQALILAPAQRVDVIGDVVGDELAVHFDSPQLTPTQSLLGAIPVQGQIPERSDTIVPLEANDYQAPNVNQAVELKLLMEGGAMSRRMMFAMMGGSAWLFNGKAGTMEMLLYTFKVGQSGVIDLINDTSFDHAIHLHGHHFQALKSGDLLPMRDTILIKARQRQAIACVFNNPGKWLIHCHMLGHQASGMMARIDIVA